MVIVDEDVTCNGRPLYTEIVHRALAAGLAGASAFRGIEGFGHTRTLHSNRILSLAENLPVLVVAIDTAERIDAFLAELAALDVGGVVAVDDVEVIGPTTKDLP
jgi:PII-like signaling protein